MVMLKLNKVKYIRGYSLTGKTAILHIVNLGSSPDFSILL